MLQDAAARLKTKKCARAIALVLSEAGLLQGVAGCCGVLQGVAVSCGSGLRFPV